MNIPKQLSGYEPIWTHSSGATYPMPAALNIPYADWPAAVQHVFKAKDDEITELKGKIWESELLEAISRIPDDVLDVLKSHGAINIPDDDYDDYDDYD